MIFLFFINFNFFFKCQKLINKNINLLNKFWKQDFLALIVNSVEKFLNFNNFLKNIKIKIKKGKKILG